MARRSSQLDALVERFAQMLVDRISASTPRGTPRDGTGSRRGAKRGRKRDMRCRYPGCKNRSKGPRFRYLCEEHLKLPKKTVKAAIEKAQK
ncbi:MAG TPA: hypothetical protein VN928_03025 [Myxococcales bacterium]|nr:hypothetical protein [Myxococcales bacterium]